MKNLIIALIAIVVAASVQAQSIQWVTRGGGTSGDAAAGIGVDALGNSYATGAFTGTSSTFGATNCTGTAYAGNNMYIVKLNPAGSVVWVKSPVQGSFNSCNPQAIVTDRAGNSYVTGSFVNTVNFGGSTAPLYGSSNTNNLFIVKYDNAGNAIWAEKAQSNSGNVEGKSLTIDNAGNVYIQGGLQGTVSFGSSTLSTTNPGRFVVKYNNNGGVAWVQKIGSEAGPAQNGWGIKISSDGKLYVTGSFNVSGVFGYPNTITITKNQAMFLAKLETDGTAIWAKSYDGDLFTFGGITSDNAGNCIVAGYANGSITFDSQQMTQTNGFFMVKFNSGGIAQWLVEPVNNIPGTRPYSVTTDLTGNVYVTGYSDANVIFGSYTKTSKGIFVVKCTPGGAISNALFLGDTQYEKPAGIIADENENIFLTGNFEGTENWGNQSVTSAGGDDVFFLLFGNTLPLGIHNSNSPQADLQVFPNPTTGSFMVNLPFSVTNAQVKVYSIVGELILDQVVAGSGFPVEISGVAQGIYTLQVITDNTAITKKFSKQ